MEIYKAHVNANTGEIQSVKQHSENTAKMCRDFSIPELKDLCYLIGLAHDIGKYQKSFQERINGRDIKVEHSGCGAQILRGSMGDMSGLIASLCVAGHHTGLPDIGIYKSSPHMSTLSGRLMRLFENCSAYKEELEFPKINERSFVKFLVTDCNNDKKKLIDKFAFITRYCFSCLVDADSLDTAEFCEGHTDRDLKTDFEKCLNLLDRKLSSFKCETELQKTRSLLQRQVFNKSSLDSEIYLMNMPTGSGKTLCSMKFALERAIKKGKKRIIYIIPYNSIIDQTARTFESIFGEDGGLLRHQSTFSLDSMEDYSEDYRNRARYASENWNSQLIVTTAVQFFESVYSNRRGKLRKFHNMSDSILVFDEAHLMPYNYLQPCLEAVSFITKYLNSEAVFLTATMPDFRDLINRYALPNSQIADLIDDKDDFNKFNKCKFSNIGLISEEGLLCKAGESPSSLIVVNSRKMAVKLYSMCTGKKYHLSTYMTPYDRERVIDEIREQLRIQDETYADLNSVPEEERITVISTSLIEAGVDLDFHRVFRQILGLDNILQAGGRCNREGKRKTADVFVFEFDSQSHRPSSDVYKNITKGLFNTYGDISCQESIQDYYRQFFKQKEKDIVKNSMHEFCRSVKSVCFKTYGDNFELIESNTVSVVAGVNDESERLIEHIKKTGFGNSRRLQYYAFSVKLWEFEELHKQHVIDDYGSGIYCLTNSDYYDKDTGVLFEGKDYVIDDLGGGCL